MNAPLSCPACGAPLETQNPGLVMAVCGHCGNTVWWDEEAVRSVGQRSILPEGFTRLFRGATGAIQGRRFLVLGRVRYGFGRGFWDEWFVELQGGATRWLTEDDHELSLQQPLTGVQIPDTRSLFAGSRLNLADTTWVVEETGEAQCLGAEGSLPEVFAEGETFRYVDGSSLDGKHNLGIEVRSSGPRAFRGRWLPHDLVTLDDEGEGW